MHAIALSLAVAFGVATSATPARAATVPDAWITTKVKMALLTAEDVPATAVSVDTVDGKVTLHGTVSSADEKARAETAARGVSGVADVRNLLQVVEKPQQKAMEYSDEQISTEVTKRLKAEPGLADSSVKVESVNGGVVLLSGDAKTLTDHLQAMEIAESTPGVKRVASEVKSPDQLADDEIWHDQKAPKAESEGMTSAARDMWITTDVKVRLIADSETPGTEINVDTTDGVVTLFGSVPSAASRTAAEGIAKKVDGVKGVENHLQVVPPVSAAAVAESDDRVKAAIESRLETRALPDSDIDVEVSKGVARLTGTVKTQADRLTALTVARSTGGVRSVVGDLTIKN
jgi:osmotically-inducible protein OsmY